MKLNGPKRDLSIAASEIVKMKQNLFPKVSINILHADVELIKFKNRGEWYNPPKWHLKRRISDLHPVSIAQLALIFYRSYIVDAETWLERG